MNEGSISVEGLAEPFHFVHDPASFDERELRLIMRENTRRLIESPSAAA